MFKYSFFLLFAVAFEIISSNPIELPYDPELNPDLFEGDILGVDPNIFKNGEEPRNAVRDPELLWPGGIIYYSISNEYTSEELAVLDEAFQQYEEKTCLKFVERIDEPNYISIMKTGGGCSSYVGMIGGSQRVSLDSSCFRCSSTGCSPGSVIHEFMHAAGFHHEQSRTDRDDFVTINWANIQQGKEHNFEKYGQDLIQHLGADYDYGEFTIYESVEICSVLHYGAYGFAIDPTVPTIYAPAGVTIGQRVGFSEVDLFKLNVLYNCSNKSQKI